MQTDIGQVQCFLDTWEPQDHLLQCQDMIDKFEKHLRRNERQRKEKEQRDRLEKLRKFYENSQGGCKR